MNIPTSISLVLPFVPVVARGVVVGMFWHGAKLPMGEAARVEPHRSLIVALAGFSLAGIAVVGTDAKPQFGPALFDIVFSFLCFLASLGVQAWKHRWWHDQLADAMRDAASTALLLFVLRFSLALRDSLNWGRGSMAVILVLAAVAWVFDAGVHVVYSARYLRSLAGGHDGTRLRAP